MGGDFEPGDVVIIDRPGDYDHEKLAVVTVVGRVGLTVQVDGGSSRILRKTEVVR